MQPLLTIEQLRVRRSLQFSLNIERLRLHKGTIMCIVGPNGGGKTTLLECITGLLTPTSGTVTLAGAPVSHNLRATKRALGYIPDDEHWFVKELCAREYFALLEGIYRQAGASADMKKRVRHMASLLHFTAFDQQLQHLSHGNKKKVQIIAGIMHEPALIVLDEVRNGLDPLAIIAVESVLRQEIHRGASILAATHDLWWTERIADEVVIVLDGTIAVQRPIGEVLKHYGSLEKMFIATLNSNDK